MLMTDLNRKNRKSATAALQSQSQANASNQAIVGVNATSAAPPSRRQSAHQGHPFAASGGYVLPGILGMA